MAGRVCGRVSGERCLYPLDDATNYAADYFTEGINYVAIFSAVAPESLQVT